MFLPLSGGIERKLHRSESSIGSSDEKHSSAVTQRHLRQDDVPAFDVSVTRLDEEEEEEE